jgi:hypothetical protein
MFRDYHFIKIDNNNINAIILITKQTNHFFVGIFFVWNNHHFYTISPKSSSKSSTSGLAKSFQCYLRHLLSCPNLGSASINSVSTLPVTAAVATSLKLSLQTM